MNFSVCGYLAGCLGAIGPSPWQGFYVHVPFSEEQNKQGLPCLKSPE